MDLIDLQSFNIMDEQCDPLIQVETSGRPSILRISQKENVPPKGSMKLSKVSFQTPVRDPFTRKVLGSHLTNTWDALEAGKYDARSTGSSENLDVTEGKVHEDSGGTSDFLGFNLQPEKTEAKQTTANGGSHEDEEHISPKGTYTLDFDMLDAMNPFQGVSKILNSPAEKLSNTKLDCVEQCSKISSVNDQALHKKTTNQSQITPSNSNADHVSKDVPSPLVESPSNVEQNCEVIISPNLSNCGKDSHEKMAPSTSQSVQISQLPPKDSISLKTGEPKLPSTLPEHDQSSQNTKDVDLVQPVRLEIEFNDNCVKCEKPPPEMLGQRPGGQLQLKKPATTAKKTVCGKSKKQTKEAIKQNEKTDSDALGPKMEYNIEWDKLDDVNFNPFGGGSKIGNSPCSAKLPATNSDGLCTSDPVENVDPNPIEKEMGEVQRSDEDPKIGDLLSSNELPGANSDGQYPNTIECVEPAVRETDEVQKPASSATNSDELCTSDPVENVDPIEKEMGEVQRSDEDPKIGDFLSSNELPGANSDGPYPTTIESVDPAVKETDEVQKPTSFAQTINCNGVPTMAIKQPSKKNTCKVKPMMEVSASTLSQDCVPSPTAESMLASGLERLIADARVPSTMTDAETLDVIDFGYSEPGSSAFRNGIIEDEAEEFRPADQIAAFNQPIEIDYLEQFGHSLFHASALRKQSLYLKFDPLLRESPLRHMETNSGLTNQAPDCSTLRDLETRPNQHAEQPEEMLDIHTLIPDLQPTINPGADFVSVLTEDAIIEVLKYSQKDMDAAILAVKEEVTCQKTITLEWKQKYEESLAQCAEMKKIVSEYSEVIFQMMEESSKKSELAKAELEKVTEEKLQALKELNSVEKSFSEVFKRFDKQKEAIEGYRKNEESLKKCAQDYLARIKKEEQRYQALKVHAEEKLNQANEEIAQVRNKYKAEVAALKAHLRKEQMKANSLERSLEEKTKENVELSKICDELISKMETI
ncbi:transforming acidic coiled-coil-containing protein 3 [Scyliorhinus canicula]|uniref:transforming acidic coiled-coil-containing protein 3 n=1 Tax=Scyliorhinus canicula TaxID=7830 RepID=UPI0018F4EF59|nr:transforming acidic coiled-coil-containing protein 3 [Scyliorhinus canicula]